MKESHSSIESALRSRIAELDDQAREHESLVRALQAGEVDAFVVLEDDEEQDSLHRLHTDEPLYRTIVDALPQAVATVLSDGTIVYANRQLTAMIGAAAETLLGANLLDYVADADREIVRVMLPAALLSTKETPVVFRWTKGETPTLVSAMRLPISGVDAVALVIMDVSDQIARKAAEEASRAKDDLLASVSHELRTPLTAIVGWIQLLELDSTRDHTEAFANLKAAVAAEVKIVDDLLDLSRSEKGSLSLVMQQFDLRDVLRTAASFVTLQAENKSVPLRLELPDEEIPVRGDPDRLRQVFVNLLTNAVKFTAKGEVSLVASTSRGNALVSVTDSGAGISAEFLPLVFEPFRRADRTQTYPGLGIGLSIARRIVEAHAGTIEAASAGVNCGSRFTVKLPLI